MVKKHLAPNTKTSLKPLGSALMNERTTALLKSRQLEVVRIILLQGKRLLEHKAPGEMTVQCLEGRVSFSTPDQCHELVAGDFLHLEAGVPHALEALTDSSLLITLAIQNA